MSHDKNWEKKKPQCPLILEQINFSSYTPTLGFYTAMRTNEAEVRHKTAESYAEYKN